jgi:hypothetical protein
LPVNAANANGESMPAPGKRAPRGNDGALSAFSAMAARLAWKIKFVGNGRSIQALMTAAAAVALFVIDYAPLHKQIRMNGRQAAMIG